MKPVVMCKINILAKKLTVKIEIYYYCVYSLLLFNIYNEEQKKKK